MGVFVSAQFHKASPAAANRKQSMKWSISVHKSIASYNGTGYVMLY